MGLMEWVKENKTATILIAVCFAAIMVLAIVLIVQYSEHLNSNWNRTNLWLSDAVTMLSGNWKSVDNSGNTYTFQSSTVKLNNFGKFIMKSQEPEARAIDLMDKTFDYLAKNNIYDRKRGQVSAFIPLNNVLRGLLGITDPNITRINVRQLGVLGEPIDFIVTSSSGTSRTIKYSYEIAFTTTDGGMYIRLKRVSNGTMFNLIMSPASSSSPQKLSLIDNNVCDSQDGNCLVPIAIRA